MKIIHTGDLHLIKEGDRRWDALVEVVSRAKHESVDILIISGDLFDSDADAEALRVPLRSIFEKAEFDTLVIPGNHDVASYAAGLLFGDRVRILSNAEWTMNVFDTEECRFIGVPFEAIDSQEFHQRLRGLRGLIDPDLVNILLYHGELLDASFDRGSFGPEAGRYMPSRLDFFEDLGVDYVLAGHFHTTFDVRMIGEGRYFVYPGSPVSITRREVGKRHAALIEIGATPVSIPLNTHYFEHVNITLNAFSDDDPLEVVRERLGGVDPSATVLLSVGGTMQGSEEQLAEAIKAELAGLSIEAREFSFRDLSRVVGHPVFAQFEERLSGLLLDEENEIGDQEAEQLRELVIQAMSEAGI